MTVRKSIEYRAVEVNRYTCDRCGNEADGYQTCSLCKRDLCTTCSLSDPDEFGDSRARFCYECWELGEKPRARIDLCEAEEEEQREFWRMACVQARHDDERAVEEARAKALSGDRGEAT